MVDKYTPNKITYTHIDPNGTSRAKTIAKFLDIGLSTWWKWVQEGKAPQPIKLSPTCSVWRNADVIAWINSKQAEQAEG